MTITFYKGGVVLSDEVLEERRHAMDFKASGAAYFPRMLTDRFFVLGNYYFNLYLVIGQRASALVEVGVSAVVDEVIRQLEELEVRPAYLVVTHPHSDHVTGLAGLREAFPEARIVAGEGAAEFLAHPKAAAALVTEDKHVTEFFASLGLSRGRPPVQEPPSLSDALIVADGDEIDLGGLTLRFLVVRGHAPGKIVVHIPEIGALILSDSLGFRYPGCGVLPLPFTNYDDYMATLDRLQRLDPVILGIAHQGPVMGAEVRQAFEESREAAAALRKRILEDSRQAEQIAKELFDHYYRDELLVYTPENILNCAHLLVRRARE